MCENACCLKYTIENERLKLELQNCTDQKAWLEGQTPKLEKQLRALKVSAAEKEHSALDSRRKIQELEKKLKSEQLSFQHHLKKLTAVLKTKDSKIEELNARLRKSPKRKAPIVNEPVEKPMFTKIYDNGVLTFDLPKCQELQDRAELKVVEAVLQDQKVEYKRLETVYSKLSRFCHGDNAPLAGNIMSQLEVLATEISCRYTDCIPSDEVRELKNELSTLQGKLELSESLLRASDKRANELLEQDRQLLCGRSLLVDNT